jgi:XPG domain containing
MGIPKLIQTLQPFAERVVIGNSNPANQRSSNNECPPPFRQMSVVIDGPSLIYHVYHQLLSLKASHFNLEPDSRPAPKNPFASQPSYTEINQAVLAFIGHLQIYHNIEVQKIYFDGGLPSSKRDVRLVRLEEGRKKLLKLRQLQRLFALSGRRAMSPDTGSPYQNQLGDDNEGKPEHEMKKTMKVKALFDRPASLPASLRLLPAPPFMVPAAIEYLRSRLKAPMSVSKHRPSSTTPNPQIPHPCLPIAQVVPGEADTYCAVHAKKTGAAILTSDSDLLAYDLGEEASVILFPSLEISTPSVSEKEGEKLQVLLGTRYHPPSLKSNLGISCTLQYFCFQRSLDPSRSTCELEAQCRKSLSSQLESSKDEVWRRFMQQYSGDVIAVHPDEEVDRRADSKPPRCGYKLLTSDFQDLDPRIAELVSQLQEIRPDPDRKATAAEKYDEACEKDETLHIYLPLLLEDPSRGSAWGYGSSIRKLAYTLLQHHMLCSPALSCRTSRRPMSIKEYQRRGTRIVGLPVDIIPDHTSGEAETQIQSLIDSYQSHKQECSSPPSSATVGMNDSLSAAASSPVSASNLAVPPSPWKFLALSLVSEQRILNAKAPPNNSWTERYLTPRDVPYTTTSWDDVHDQASLEAVLYSLRILKQIAGLVHVLPQATGNKGEQAGNLKVLVDALGGLGTIEEMMGVAAQKPKLGQGGKEIDKPSIEIRDQDVGDKFQDQETDKGNSEQSAESMVDRSSLGLGNGAKRQKMKRRSEKWRNEKKARTTNEMAHRQGKTGENRFAALGNTME